MKFLVCGGYGFIGSEFIRNHFQYNPHDEIINIDNLSLGSNKLNLEKIENNTNYIFKEGNITDVEFVKNISILLKPICTIWTGGSTKQISLL